MNLRREITRREAFLVWLACVVGMWALVGWCFLASEWGLW